MCRNPVGLGAKRTRTFMALVSGIGWPFSRGCVLHIRPKMLFQRAQLRSRTGVGCSGKLNIMNLDTLVSSANDQGASDLHLEAGLPAALRVRGSLRTAGEPLPTRTLVDIAKGLIGSEQWPRFLERRSFDLSRTIHGVRCRINVLQTSRGIGMAIRLLSSFQATIEKLNLHPDLKRLLTHTNGLIL